MDRDTASESSKTIRIFPPRLRPGWMGQLWRSCVYVYRRVVRQPGTPEYIARGAVVGAMVSLVLPTGQFLVAFLLAYVVRGSRPAAIVATLPVNPVTGVVIYPVEYAIGCALLHVSPLGTLPSSWEDFVDMFVEPEPATALYAYLAGSSFCALAAMLPVYHLSRFLVVKYREVKERRRARKLGALAVAAAVPSAPAAGASPEAAAPTASTPPPGDPEP